MEDSTRDLLVALANGDASSEAVCEQLRAGERRNGVVYSPDAVERRLFELERHGLVKQDETDMAEASRPGDPAPIAKRYWNITEAGNAALQDE
jgi:hypothetical protein